MAESADLIHFAGLCQVKRELLGQLAAERIAWAKHLQLAAGVLALVSAASITSLISTLSNPTTLKIFAAVVAFASGVITMVIPTYFDQKENLTILEGANRFLELRDEANTLAKRPSLTPTETYDALERLRRAYDEQSARYGQFSRFGKAYQREKQAIDEWIAGVQKS